MKQLKNKVVVILNERSEVKNRIEKKMLHFAAIDIFF